MPHAPIDLRSDTVTQPTPAMRRAMSEAEVGDDVLGADPSAARLERLVAERLGKEAAIFMPSGTMTNQVAIRLHCKPGDEFLCEQDCHIYNYEQGAFAQLSGVVARTILGHQGQFEVSQLEGLVRPENDHMVRTKLVCLENTHNRGGGHVIPLHVVQDVSAWARREHVAMHLDGARLFNAVVATGHPADEWAKEFDTVSVCFSKGLGAPVGSALAGPRDLIREARRHRKLFGGGMRQCGILAAAASYALQEHVDRLAEDHENARCLAEQLDGVEGLTLPFGMPETNIVFIDVDARLGTAREFAEELSRDGVLMLTESSRRLRVLTHLDVTNEQVLEAGRRICALAERKIAQAV